MKSSEARLENRGYLPDAPEQALEAAPFDELLGRLKDKQAVKRTAAARQLARTGDRRCIEPLCVALETETGLYTKIEICNAPASFGAKAVPNLIRRLGKIGKNQHKEVAKEKFGKTGYPLPRDIAARTLIRIGTPALPALTEALRHDDPAKIGEAIDAVGFICFYEPQAHIFPALEDCYRRNTGNKLIRWKIVRAMSAFSESPVFLNQCLADELDKGIKQEIERSLALIARRKK